jgi:hypothetical protein
MNSLKSAKELNTMEHTQGPTPDHVQVKISAKGVDFSGHISKELLQRGYSWLAIAIAGGTTWLVTQLPMATPPSPPAALPPAQSTQDQDTIC